jgi:[ribosomal protein S5]-alanine N-acetyltransferase
VSVFETERLILRELNLGDAAFILELLNEPGFIKYIGDKGVRSLADAENYLEQGPLDSYLRNGYGLYAVVLRDGSVIGMCGLVNRIGLDDPDIGFAFLSRYGSRGFAAEAAKATMEFGRTQLKIPKIVAIVTPENAKSVAVLTKIGLRFERLIRLREGAEEVGLFT